jgi:hypothetical protein
MLPSGSARRLLFLYFAPGSLVGAIKGLSLFSWLFYQQIAVVTGRFSFGDFVTMLGLGLVGTIIAIIGWPIVVYKMIVGAASLPAVLFFPWVNPN